MIRTILLTASLFGLAACATAPAGETRTFANTPDPAVQAETESSGGLDVVVHDGEFARIEQFVTPAGISVWLVNEPSIPIVAIEAAWPGGWSSDPVGLEGLAQSMIYQMNEGAGELDAFAYQVAMEELSMSFGCSASRDWTSCSAGMLRENAEDAMDLVALAMTEPRFDDGPFERYRRESEVWLARRETNASYLAGQLVEAALYPDHPYAREMSPESLAALTPELALAHKDNVMVREGLLVTAVGAITPQELAPLIDEAFAGLPETGNIELPAPVELNAAVGGVLVEDLPQPQTLVSFTAPGMQRDHPDFLPAYVLNYTVGGGGFESRLMKELRVDRGLTYGVGTRLSFGGQIATWSGGGQTQNATAGEFIELTRQILADISENGITQAELDDAKAYLTGSYPLGFDSNAKIASNMMGVRQQALGVDYFDRRNAEVEAVTLEDVNRVARDWLSPDNFTFVAVGQPEGIDTPAIEAVAAE